MKCTSKGTPAALWGEGPGAPSITEGPALCREGWAISERPKALEGQEIWGVNIFPQGIPIFTGSHICSPGLSLWQQRHPG